MVVKSSVFVFIAITGAIKETKAKGKEGVGCEGA